MNLQVIGAMVRLRLLRTLRDRAGLVWMFVMPMVFSYMMGMLMGDWSNGAPPKRRVVVYDQDRGPAVERLLAPLRAHERFEVVVVDSAATDARARALTDNGGATAVLRIPAGFSGAMAGGAKVDLQLTVDGNRLSSQTARSVVDRSLLRMNTEQAARSLVAAPGTTPGRNAALAFDEKSFAAGWDQPRMRLQASTLGRLPTSDWGLTRAAQHAGPAYVLFFMLMFMMVSAKDLVQERQDRTLARLVISRASSFDLVAGYFLGGMVIGLVQGAILLGMNALAFGLDYGDSPAALVAVVVMFAAFASSASILLGTLARTGPQADGLGSGLTMALGAIGGLWWPLEVVPPFMQAIGKALPTGQAISIFHGLVGRGWGLGESAPLLGGLAVWFVAVFALAAARLRRQVSA
jgi:ABC-2 type transport system permease protein